MKKKAFIILLAMMLHAIISTAQVTDSLYLFKITQYICPRATNGPKGLELYYDLMYASLSQTVNFSTNPLKIRQIGQGTTGIDTTEYIINVNRTLVPNPVDDIIHGVLVLGSAGIRTYLLNSGLTQIDDATTDVMFVEVNFTFDGNDYIEVLFDAEGTGLYQLVDVFGDNFNLPAVAWTGYDANGNLVSTKGQNIEYTSALIEGNLNDEKWTDPSLRYQIVAKNDRLYGFGVLDPYSFNPLPPILDNTPPVVTSNPANNATNVAITVNPTFTFNEPIFHIDGSQITNLSAASLISMWTVVPFTNFTTTVNHSANPIITVVPTTSLDYDTEYYLQLSPVEDTVGFATTTKTIKFKTLANGSPDLSPPVASFNPNNGNVEIPMDVNPVISFNEPVKKVNGGVLTNADLSSLISLTVNGQPVSFTATINETKTQITVVPANPLTTDSWYTLTVLPVKDAAGNQSSVQTSTFKTVDLVPPVLIFNPTNGATGVSQMLTITINSNEPLSTTQGTPLSSADLPNLIQFVDHNNASIAFSASINNSRTEISITSLNMLAHSTTFTVTLALVADSLGNITTSQSTSFTTIYPPQITFYPADETYGIHLSVNPTITFDRAVRKVNGTLITNDDLPSIVSLVDEEMNPVPFAATINPGKTLITITPSNLLMNNSVYTLTLEPVEDIFGNETTRKSTTFITETTKVLVNFDTASFWHAEPGKNLNTDYAAHYYFDQTLQANFQGNYVIRAGSSFWPPQNYIGNYSFVTTDQSSSTYVRAIIASGGVASFRFKIKYVDGNSYLLYKVRYSIDKGLSWTDLEPIIDANFLVNNQWYTYQGVVHSEADSIMIDIMNNKLPPLRRVAIDDFEWSPMHDLSINYPITIFPVQGGSATVTTQPATQAYFKQNVTIGVSNIETGKAVLNVNVYDNSYTPIYTKTITENSEYSFRMPAGNANVLVTLGLAVTTQVIGGQATVTTNKRVALQGESITVNISDIPSTHRFVGIEVKDIFDNVVATTEITQGAHYTFVMPSNGVTVRVILEQIYNIAVLPSNGGNAQVVTDKTVAAQGESVSITISNIQTGKQVQQVVVKKTDDTSVATQTVLEGQQYTFVMPNDHVSVQVFLIDVFYTVTAVANPTAGGAISGAGNYTYGSQVTLTATPNAGYSFVNWTDAQNQEVSTQDQYSFTMPADNVTLIANFSVNSYTVTAVANPTAGGAISGAGDYNYGSQVTLTATANAGYSFVNWTNAQNQEVSTQAQYSFTMPADNVTLTANFSVNSYTVTAEANPTAGGTISGAGTYTYGSQVTLTATPNVGYSFVNWTNAQNQEVSTQAQYSFTMPSNNVALTANFMLNLYVITFHATYSGNPVADVEIVVDGFSPILTNQNGNAQISLPNGQYNYTASRSGYNSISGDFTVQNSDQTIEIMLTQLSSLNQTAVIKVYPNPVANRLVVSRDVTVPVQLRIISSTGVELKQIHWDSNSIEIDCQNYPSGIYLLQISDGTLIRFIKN